MRTPMPAEQLSQMPEAKQIHSGRSRFDLSALSLDTSRSSCYIERRRQVPSWPTLLGSSDEVCRPVQQRLGKASPLLRSVVDFRSEPPSAAWFKLDLK